MERVCSGEPDDRPQRFPARCRSDPKNGSKAFPIPSRSVKFILRNGPRPDFG